MKKQILAIVLGALVIGLIASSSGFSQTTKEAVATISGQVTKSTGGSDWSRATHRLVRDSYNQTAPKVPFSASGYYSGVTSTKWKTGNVCRVNASAMEGTQIWYGQTYYTLPATTVDIVASP